MNTHAVAKPFRIMMLLLAWIPVHAQAADEQKCPDKVIAAMRMALSLSMDDPIQASTCKPWPDDKSKMLVAMVAGSETGEMQYPIHLAMINAETYQVLSRHTSAINGDATTQLYGSSLWLDTARYFLNKDTRAFGLRISSFRDRCTYSGGFDNELKLFVIEGFTMRPVLEGLYMSSWSYEGNRCDAEGEVTEKRVDLSLSVEPTHTNGYADLLITANTSDNKKKINKTMKLKYNGKQYAPIPFTAGFLE